jgi:hypothetical protein
MNNETAGAQYSMARKCNFLDHFEAGFYFNQSRLPNFGTISLTVNKQTHF